MGLSLRMDNHIPRSEDPQAPAARGRAANLSPGLPLETPPSSSEILGDDALLVGRVSVRGPQGSCGPCLRLDSNWSVPTSSQASESRTTPHPPENTLSGSYLPEVATLCFAEPQL